MTARSTTRAGQQPRQRMSRAERERQILTVAEDLFAERGYAQATMDELAERVGVSKPVIYDYFGSKEGLLLALLTRVRGELYAATRPALDAAASPREGLRASLTAFFCFIDGHRAAWSVLNRESALVGAEALAAVERLRSQQAEFLGAFLVGAGAAPDPATAAVYAQILVGAAERLALWQEHHPALTAEAAADHLMNALWNGMSGART
ncbi:TetR/AcrR family transcriptional regulator [Streptomyces sp. DSM 44917]|uniref:TetR/AcrR family transcriptional regulator n=1 Tax=Streptomyces boetiae TaxID=3075541 RepID=A0ABU2L2H8_9ACTN|nr:TetR/AcrR family transcriptional regulator [Streptomyces sp. DSM 44917]MDT0305572.1 TetR/AcrR family transcriptional regulator [Streptomyces sp. DSM 44917]